MCMMGGNRCCHKGKCPTRTASRSSHAWRGDTSLSQPTKINTLPLLLWLLLSTVSSRMLLDKHCGSGLIPWQQITGYWPNGTTVNYARVLGKPLGLRQSRCTPCECTKANNQAVCCTSASQTKHMRPSWRLYMALVRPSSRLCKCTRGNSTVKDRQGTQDETTQQKAVLVAIPLQAHEIQLNVLGLGLFFQGITQGAYCAVFILIPALAVLMLLL